MDAVRDPGGKLRSLVDLAVASDDSRRLVAVAGQVLGHPLGLVNAGAEPLAFTPEDETGQRALAVATAAARSRTAPSGWRTVSLVHHSHRLGVLAVGANGPDDAETRSGLAMLPMLLTDQLRRGGLVRLHSAAFVRRLVGASPLAPYRARREAAELDIALADAYWPAIVAWATGTVAPEVLERVEHDARRLAERSLTALLNGHLVLLHPGSGGDAAAWFRRVAALTRALAPASRARAVAAEGPVDIGGLSAAIAGLLQLHQFGPRSAGDLPLTWSREYALDGLLYGRVEPTASTEFVDRHLGPLIEWDHDHGTDLVAILEAALDFPRHDRAAERCFMHRNTFRRRVRQATELLGEDLESPDVRLAVHVALKLRRLAGVSNGGTPRSSLRA
jgi:hypothetical protein